VAGRGRQRRREKGSRRLPDRMNELTDGTAVSVEPRNFGESMGSSGARGEQRVEDHRADW